MLVDTEAIDRRIDALARHRFRAKFHLYGRDRALVVLRGRETIRKHAADFNAERVAPAAPRKDGQQTPYRGHPGFVAQHATATCCRTCLEPTNSVLAITLGALIIVPAIVTMWTTSARIERAEVTVGVERPASGPVIFILLLLIGPVGIWYTQSELNKVWSAQAGADTPPPPAVSVPEAPEAPSPG